jgi:ComF family protein
MQATPALGKQAKSWLEAGLGFFYPEVCQICGKERAGWEAGYVCVRCRGQEGGIRPVKPPFCACCGLPYEGDIGIPFECSNCREMDLQFRSARAAVVATDMVLKIIHRYKYHRQLWFEPLLSGLLVQQAAPELRRGRWRRIVPVPLHPEKRREREFNQAEVLAVSLGRATGLPVDTRILERREPTPTQTQLTRSERAANVRHAFSVKPGRQLREEPVVIVDDVLTTGATTSACARALKSAGATDIVVWTVARGL